MSLKEDKINFFDSLTKVEKENDKSAKKELAIQAIRMHLPSLYDFHRKEFAKKLSGESYDGTTVSLAVFSLKCLMTYSQDEEEKRLLDMFNNVLILFE